MQEEADRPAREGGAAVLSSASTWCLAATVAVCRARSDLSEMSRRRRWTEGARAGARSGSGSRKAGGVKKRFRKELVVNWFGTALVKKGLAKAWWMSSYVKGLLGNDGNDIVSSLYDGVDALLFQGFREPNLGGGLRGCVYWTVGF